MSVQEMYLYGVIGLTIFNGILYLCVGLAWLLNHLLIEQWEYLIVLLLPIRSHLRTLCMEVDSDREIEVVEKESEIERLVANSYGHSDDLGSYYIHRLKKYLSRPAYVLSGVVGTAWVGYGTLVATLAAT